MPNDTVNGPGDCDSMAVFVAIPKDVLKLSFLFLIQTSDAILEQRVAYLPVGLVALDFTKLSRPSSRVS